MARSNQRANGFIAKPIKHRRAFEEVLLQLRQAVVERRLEVGDRLPHERELANLFEVSRQSVREGLRMLEAFGVLTARRGVGPESGWIVSGNGTSGLSVLLDLYTSLQRIPLWDLLEIREALELLSVRSAALRADSRRPARAPDFGPSDDGALPSVMTFSEPIPNSTCRSRASPAIRWPRFSWKRSATRWRASCSPRSKRWRHGRSNGTCSYASTSISQPRFVRATPRSAAEALSAHIRGFYGRALAEISIDTPPAKEVFAPRA